MIALAMEGERRGNVTVNVERVDVWKSGEEVRELKVEERGAYEFEGNC